ncbi:MAG: SAM hydrolase/SAM-dependent halogenase family protein [Candidatus Helarchaeota archaeon]
MEPEKRPIVTLLTDFGWRDPYISSMKGVILTISRDAQIVDISHSGPKFNIRFGAYLIAFSAPFFPPGTVHAVVVDPGVGSDRLPIAIETISGHFFVGPDNGIFSLVIEKCGGIKKVVEIKNKKYLLEERSDTFHGRDVFAPVAAHLASGVPIDEIGPALNEIIKLEIQAPVIKNKTIEGAILFTDSFGNAITNIPKELINKLRIRKGSYIEFELGAMTREVKFCKSYSEVKKHDFLMVMGSRGLLEISMNQGNAAESLNLDLQGRKIIIRKMKPKKTHKTKKKNRE